MDARVQSIVQGFTHLFFFLIIEVDTSRTKVGESGVSCNSFYSNPCSVKSVEYLKLLFISLGSPLATLEREIFKLTKGCLMSEKIAHK